MKVFKLKLKTNLTGDVLVDRTNTRVILNEGTSEECQGTHLPPPIIQLLKVFFKRNLHSLSRLIIVDCLGENCFRYHKSHVGIRSLNWTEYASLICSLGAKGKWQ